MANEPKRPKIIKEQSSIFDMPTGAMRSSPEVIVLELMRTLFFDKPNSTKSQFLNPDLEGFSEKEILAIKLPDNANIKKLRNILNKIISDKRLKNNLNDLSKTAVFFTDNAEVINDNYKLKNNEIISIIPPIGGG